MTNGGGGCIELSLRVLALKEVHCCGSCHEDWDYGCDDALEIGHEGELYEVCCALFRAYEAAPK